MGGNLDHRQMADKAYRKWMKKQKGLHKYDIIDFRKSYIAAGESKQFDTLLWSGLAVLLTGTVISFVGLGEKGFKTSYLRLLGPILCGVGFAVVMFRIGLCCFSTSKQKAKVAIDVKEQLSKVVHVHHAVAVRSIQYRPGGGPSIIPSIQIDPSRFYNSDLKKAQVIILQSYCRLRIRNEKQRYSSYRFITRRKSVVIRRKRTLTRISVIR